MSQVQDRADLGNIEELSEFIRLASILMQALVDTVNGQLEFDKNIRSQVVQFTAPSIANTDFTLIHTLGKTGVRYILAGMDTASVLYDGAAADTNSTKVLRCNTGGTKGYVILF
jgi:hypothetical protein